MIGDGEDLDGFFDLAEFAVEGVVDGRVFPVIFDNPRELIALGEVGIDSEIPQATAKAVDVSGIFEGDGISIRKVDPNGVRITLGDFTLSRDPLDDGTGLAVIQLSKG